MAPAWTSCDTNYSPGPIARIGPGVLLTSSSEVWAHVNRHPGYKRSDWYYHAARIEHRQDNIFTQTDNELHDNRRRQMVAGVGHYSPFLVLSCTLPQKSADET